MSLAWGSDRDYRRPTPAEISRLIAEADSDSAGRDPHPVLTGIGWTLCALASGFAWYGLLRVAAWLLAALGVNMTGLLGG